MEYQDLLYFLEHVNTDPSRLIFEDELSGIYNRFSSQILATQGPVGLSGERTGVVAHDGRGFFEANQRHLRS